MTIIRAPRPASGFSIVDNQLLRHSGMSRGATLLLLQILSHTDNWKTDTASLVEAGTEGRDAVLSMLREMEDHRFLKRYKRQGEKGRWIWERWVFDHPADDAEVGALITASHADPDEIEEGWSEDNSDAPAWAQDSVSPQVSPCPDFPSTASPPTDAPPTAPPSPAKASITTREDQEEKTRKNSVGGVSHQRAREAKPPPEIPPNHDEHGPLSAQCPRHVGRLDDPPCPDCRDVKPEFKAAQDRRANARAKAKAADDRRSRDVPASERRPAPPAVAAVMAQIRARHGKHVPDEEHRRAAFIAGLGEGQVSA